MLTNLAVFFQEPVIIPPIKVNDPSKGGVPSDHSGVEVIPRAVTDVSIRRQKFVRTIRPITSSALANIDKVFSNEKWNFMDQNLSSTSLTELFQFYSGEILNIFCPEKQVYSRPNELPWVTEKMKFLKRSIMREYEKRGLSEQYFQLKY